MRASNLFSESPLVKLLASRRLPILLCVILIWNQPGFTSQEGGEQSVSWGEYLPSGNGKAYVETLCSGCHSLEKVVMQRRTEDEWRAVVGKMVGEQAAPISEWEAKEIVEYLGERFGPLQEPREVKDPRNLQESMQQDEIDWAMLLPDDTGKELILPYCIGCHGLDHIVKSRKSKDAWYNTVTWMIDSFSAMVLEEDIDPIVDYLSVHAGEGNPIIEVPMDLNLVPAEAFQRLRFLSSIDIAQLLEYRSSSEFKSMEEFQEVLTLDGEKFRLSKIYLEVR